MENEKTKSQPPTYIDENGETTVDYLSMHQSDGDMRDWIMDIEEQVLREEGDEEGLAILNEERLAIKEGREDEYYDKLRAEGIEV